MAQVGNGKVGPVASFGLLAAVIAAISGAIYWQSRLVPSRPAMSAGEARRLPGEGKVPARLWQDPLTAARERVGVGCRDPRTSPEGKAELVLPVILPGGDSFEDHENRLRSRYAVAFALGAAGYMPEDSEHLRLACLEPGSANHVVPYEWFNLSPLEPQPPASGEPSAPRRTWKRILAVWVSDRFLGERPLFGLHKLLKRLSPWRASTAPCRVLGPSDSDGLNRMITEPPQPGPRLEFYSSWVTADSALLGLERAPPSSEPGPVVVATIATDSQTAEKLVEELAHRGVEVGQDSIALVSEWDTWYGRALPLAFAAAAAKVELRGRTPWEALEAINQKWPARLLRVPYLRGLDGEVPRPSSGAPGAPNPPQPAAPKEEKAREAAAIERPEGQSQLDYARRLAAYLPKWGDIAAIGVLGSDLYDKLLLLQALRPRFPRAVFFTTDLDARLLHPAENRWARNLIVASSFGLESPPGVPGIRPPFRGNYQTALFVATLRALDCMTDQAVACAMHPRVYEVGRTRAYPLPGENEPGNPHLALIAKLALAAALLLVLLVVWHQVRVRHQEQSWRTLLPYGAFWLVVGVGWVVVATRGGAPEPFEPFEGISVWPSELIRLAAGFLAFYLLLTVCRRLARNTKELRARFALAGCPDGPQPFSRPWWSELRRPFTRDWTASSAHFGAGELWQQYQACERPSYRCVRVLAYSLPYSLFAFVLISAFGPPGAPYRGEASRLAYWLILALTVPLLVLLTFLVLDVTVLCERFVRGVVRHLRARAAVDNVQGLQAKGTEPEEDGLRSVWRVIDLLARRTEAVNPTVLYPFLVLALLILSRSPFFDRWVWSTALVGIWSVISVFAILCALILRGAAESARRAASECLRRQRLAAQAAGKEQRAKLLSFSLEEIERERRGAFAPLVEQPALRALLLPFGGLGAAAYLEPFMNLF